MALKRLTNDQNCQLKQWAGNTAAELIDDLLDDAAKAKEVVGAELPEEAGTYYLTVTIADGEGPVYAWAPANNTQAEE